MNRFLSLCPLSRLAQRLVLLVTIGASSALWAQAPRTLATPTAEPAQVRVQVATKVRFYADIRDATVMPNGVNLLRVGATGTTPSIVGVLHDDGTGGDEIAGDGRYSVEVTLNEPIVAPVAFRISAAFRGTLLRTVTPDIVVDVLRDRPPVAVPGTTQAVRVGAHVLLDGRDSYDLDGDLLKFTWSLVKPSGSAATLDGPSFVKPAFVADVAGVYRARLLVNDGQVDSVVQEVVVQAYAGNAPPAAIIAAVPVRPFGPASIATVPLSGASSFDPEASALTYAWKLVSTPASSTNATLTSFTGAAPSLVADKPGRYVVELTVSDGTQPSVPVRRTITLYNPNTPPAADAGADRAVATSSTVTLAGFASDADADPLASVRWNFVERPAGSTAALVNAGTLAPSFTADVAGDYLVELVATDSRGAAGKARIVIRASGPADSDHDGVPDTADACPNTPLRAPVDAKGCAATQLAPVTISVLTANPGAGVGPLAVSFRSQAAGGAGGYTYRWTFGDAGTNTTQNPTHTYLLPNAYVATVTATDALGSMGHASVTIVVNAVSGNKAPVVSAGANITIALPASATLNGTASDDGLPNPPGALSTKWSVVSGPGAVTFQDASQKSTTASFTLPGAYVLRLTGDDGALKTTSDVTVTAGDGGPVFAALADRTIPLGSHFALRVRADDPNPLDVLTFRLLTAPAGATITPDGLLDWTPAAAQLGVNTFAIQAVDGFGHVAARNLKVTVTNGDRAPVLADQADVTLPAGAVFSRTLVATDADGGDVLTFGLLSGPSAMTLIGAQLAWNTTGLLPGSYPVIVQVTDAQGLFDVKRFVLAVTAAAAPVANDDHYSVILGHTLDVPAAGVLANDVDPMGGALVAGKLGDPPKGTLTAFRPDGSFTYQAPPTLQLPPFQPVVKSNFEGNNFTTDPVVADLDGDGKAETVVRYFNGIGAIRQDGSLLWSKMSFAAPYADCFAAYGSSTFGVAVGDIDDDGKVEVVTSVRCNRDAPSGGPESRYIALNGIDGSVKWLSPPLSALTIPTGPNFGQVALASSTSPTIARLRAGESPSVVFEVEERGAGGSDGTIGIDASGNPIYGPACMHIVATVPDGTYHYPDASAPGHYAACSGVIVLDGTNGTVRQRMIAEGRGRDGGTQQAGLPAPIVADLDGDGVQEIVAGSVVFNVDGSIKWRDPALMTAETAIGNFDDTPDVEVVRYEGTDDLGQSISVRKPDGTLVWRVPMDSQTVVSKLTVADIDGSGHPSILFNLHSNLCALDYKGNYRWCYNAYRDGVEKLSSYSRHAVFDLDGDGVPEIIVSAMEHLIFLDGPTGMEKFTFDVATIPNSSFPPSTRNNSYETPAPIVADMDGDGHADVVFTWVGNDFAAPSRLTILKAQNNDWQPAPRVMNQEAYFGANVNPDATIPHLPLPNNFATPAGNVYGSQPRLAAAVDPRKREQAAFSYAAHAGALQSAPTTVTIDLLPVNRPPVFVSTPPLRYIKYTPFNYAAHAVDPDVGDTVTYSLVTRNYSGGDCGIGATSGMLSCNQIQTNDTFIVIAATDNQGASVFQTIRLQSSTGVAPVPDVVGQSQATASASLVAAGFLPGSITQVASALPVGQVLAQVPGAGTSTLNGEAVALSVSSGPAPVPVPFVTGEALTLAQSTLQGSGFTASVTRVFSDTIAADMVIAQSPVAGTSRSPTSANPVALTVSAGNGLTLQLDRSVTTANVPIHVTVLATAADGSAVPVPPMTFAVMPQRPEFLGTLPTVAANTVTPGAGTVGAFVLTGTDAATGRTVRAEFVVTAAADASGTSNGATFAKLSQALESIYALRPALVAARKANDTAQMTALLRQMVTIWRTVDIDDLKLAQPISTPDQFPPTVQQLAALGQAATPEDLLVQHVIDDANAALQAWTQGLSTSGVTFAQLDALADQFAAKSAALSALDVSEFGGIANAGRYHVAVGHRVPAFFEALMNEYALLTGMPTRGNAFPQFKAAALSRPAVAPKFTLAEQATTVAVDFMVDKVMSAGVETYGNAKQYTVDILRQAEWSVAVVTLRQHLQAWLKGQDIIEVVAGASLSFREFKAAPSWIETIGSQDVDANVVIVIGPDLLSAAAGAAVNLVNKLKEGYSENLDPSTNPNRYKNPDQIKKDLTAFHDVVKQALADVNVVVQAQAKLVFQTPDTVIGGCVFSSDPACVQLVYSDGLAPVYTYSPPSGFGSFSGLPVPIVFLTYNAATGGLYFGTPAFLPCGTATANGKTTVTCPNTPPFEQ